ncbi:MAG: protein-glutamate O-methyltransferase CheR [Calditrichaceae bacterium]
MTNEHIEIQCLLDAVFRKYGYDFREYSDASIKRRLRLFQDKFNYGNFAYLMHDLLEDELLFESLLLDLTVNVTEMFRDPSFYKALRKVVIPILKTYPRIKIWHAGCSTGEEVYSMAILLQEEGLLKKSTIYATDINEKVLGKAKDGIYPLDRIKAYTINYQKSGGSESFAEYYSAKPEGALMLNELKKHVVFSQHNLVTDSVFSEMHLVICRNVLIYFNKNLQERSIALFADSLIRKGILCLGSKETIRFTSYADKFGYYEI